MYEQRHLALAEVVSNTNQTLIYQAQQLYLAPPSWGSDQPEK